MTTEVVLHSSIVGVWFCLNAMGHHIWKIIKSKSVFTRVTDGQRLRYYSFYIGLSTSIICTLALCVHFFIEEGQGVGKYNLGKKLKLITHKKGITIYIKNWSSIVLAYSRIKLPNMVVKFLSFYVFIFTTTYFLL